MDDVCQIKYSSAYFFLVLSFMETYMSEQQLDVQQNQKTTLSIKEAVAYLAEKFPRCFSTEGEAKPLKVGLFQDLSEALQGDEKLSKTQLRQILRAYTMSWRYLHACREGAVRVDLMGEEVGVIDAAQAEHAQKTLQEAKAAYAERKAKEQKEKKKAFFKQQAAKDQRVKSSERARKVVDTPKASLESLAALETKFNQKRS